MWLICSKIYACNVPSELKKAVERSKMIILTISGLSSRTWRLPPSRGRRLPPTCRGSWISSRRWLPPTTWGCRGLPPTSRGSWRLPPSCRGSGRLPSASRGQLPPSCWICWYVRLSVFVKMYVYVYVCLYVCRYVCIAPFTREF